MRNQYKVLTEKYALITEMGGTVEDWCDYFYSELSPDFWPGPINSWDGLEYFKKWTERKVNAKNGNQPPFITFNEYYKDIAEGYLDFADDDEFNSDSDAEDSARRAYLHMHKWYKKFLQNVESPEYKEWQAVKEQLYKDNPGVNIDI